MLKMVILVFLIFTTFGFGIPAPTQTNRAHDKWLQERHFEALSIKEGMTRAELLKVFRMDGGLQSFLPTRYVLRRSNFIKVDVEFEVPAEVIGKVVPEDLRNEMEVINGNSASTSAPENYHFVANEKLKIKSISRPYLEQFNYD